MINAENTLQIAGVVKESIVDGPGLRFVVFAQGCPHNCDGCHNPATHDFKGGYACELQTIINAIDKDPILSGVTFSGGEPFHQAEAFYLLALKLKEKELNLLSFSGYTYEELVRLGEHDEYVIKLLDILDSLIDGRFILEQRDLTLNFKGSRNQRFIDLNQTRETGRIVEIS